jgi:putative hydrolase of HD superfamily
MESFFEFLRAAEKLKYEKRDNKLANGEYESVAAHTWMMSLFALLFHDKMSAPIDFERALKIIIVHDLAEAIVGDISLALQQGKEALRAKAENEKIGIAKLTSILPPSKASEIMALWQEYEDNSTPEAKFAKACDKLEAGAQALMFGTVAYWRDYGGDFYYDDALNARREKYWKHEPAFCEFYDLLRKKTIEYMDAEGLDSKKYLESSKA